MKRKAQTEPLDANVYVRLDKRYGISLAALAHCMEIDKDVVSRSLCRLKRKGLAKHQSDGWVRGQVATMEDVLRAGREVFNEEWSRKYKAQRSTFLDMLPRR